MSRTGAGETCARFIGHHAGHHVVSGDQQLRVAERLVVVTYFAGAFLERLLKPERAGADRDAIPVLEIPFRLWFTIDKDFVGTTTQLPIDHRAINDRELSVFRFDERDTARREGRQLRSRCPAHGRCCTRLVRESYTATGGRWHQ